MSLIIFLRTQNSFMNKLIWCFLQCKHIEGDPFNRFCPILTVPSIFARKSEIYHFLFRRTQLWHQLLCSLCSRRGTAQPPKMSNWTECWKINQFRDILVPFKISWLFKFDPKLCSIWNATFKIFVMLCYEITCVIEIYIFLFKIKTIWIDRYQPCLMTFLQNGYNLLVVTNFDL